MIIVIAGPTGSGKSDLAFALSNRLSNSPIINGDAFQIYQEMNIGTAKVDKDSEEYKRTYLLDIKTPEQTFSVKEYQDLFRKTYEQLSLKHKNIIVCGGTGLYIRAALMDYHFEEMEDDDVSDLEKLDNDQLYDMLLSLDKDALETIHKNNRKRMIRAISIARTHSVNKSENIKSQSHTYYYPKEDIKIFMIDMDRELLYERINKRVEIMFDKGLVDEVNKLKKSKSISDTAKAGIGYKEVLEYLDGNLTLDECKELIKKRTRNYAKRQITFFKNQFDVIKVKNIDEVIMELGLWVI